MAVKVLLFATLKELVGTNAFELDLPDGISVVQLKAQIAQRYPQLSSNLKSILVTVNQAVAFDEDSIPAGAEVALFPPVSGG